jgi:hypothetical protein
MEQVIENKEEGGATEAVVVQQAEAVTAYKGFDKNLQCRGYQYEIGKTYVHEGKVEACSSGFHACENPLDVWSYYNIQEGNRFCVVEMTGAISRHDEDSKIASAKIAIKAEIGLPQIIGDAVKFVMSLVKASKETIATTGYRANAATTGNLANAATTCYRANAATTGYRANAATTGEGANAATTGKGANAATTGNLANAATTGYRANAATTGYRANAATTGEGANAATTGYRANAATTGNLANAATTGNLANAATTGEHAVAAALGIEGRAKAGVGGAIVLCHRNGDGELIYIRASKVGENGIKPDVWYSLNANGEFVATE